MTLQTSSRRAKRRWALLFTTVVALSLVGASVAQAALNTSLFELDKDATTDTTYTKLGVLNAAVATATDGATTTIQICQNVAANQNGATVLIDAERMTLASGANVAGGGCPAGFTNKKSYSATRGVGTTVPGAHAKAEDVSLINTVTGSHDWDEVYAAVAADADTKCESLDAVECAFTHDARAASIFTQSKDYDEISGSGGETWSWRDQSVPDADELDDGFAIKYVDGTGAQQLYFGADRFAANGTKDAGFWFFHDTVAALDQVGGADGKFSGVHTAPVDGDGDGFCNPAAGGTGGPSNTPNCSKYDTNDTGGDVLALTTFTGGGAVTTIRIFEWIGPAGAVSALLERATTGDCLPGPVTTAVCATVNNTTIETDWPYDGKGEPADDEIPSGGFLEGGINLTELGLEGCFSSFMATSRSSASLTADPKDFILGNFEACGVGVTTTPSNPDDNTAIDEITLGDSIYDHAVVQGTGGGPEPTGDVTFFICAPDELDEPDDGDPATPDDNPATCDVGGTQVGSAVALDPGANTTDAQATADSDPFTPDAVGTWCWRGEYSGDNIYAAATDSSDGECFDVIDTSSVLTDQSWVPNDTATITSGGGSNLTGTLTMTLYNNGTCTPGDADANVLYQESFTIDDAASPVVKTTTNGDGSGTGLAADVIFLEADSPVGALSWQAAFVGDPASTSSTGPCETTSQFTIDDNDPAP
jgi:hypothetical protein